MNWYLAIKYYISKRPRQVVIRSHIPRYRGTAADLALVPGELVCSHVTCNSNKCDHSLDTKDIIFSGIIQDIYV